MKDKFQIALLLAVMAFSAAACDFGLGPSKLVTSKTLIARLQISEFVDAIEQFQKDTSRLPTTAEGLDALVRNPRNLKGWQGPYLGKNIPLDPWGGKYIYKCPGDHGGYDLYSYGPDWVAGNADDIVNWESSK
jgi:general secretion pathway protein G